MLQCTMQPTPRPDRDDYLVVERIARDMRNQYVASLLRRAKPALAKGLARRPQERVPISVVGACYVPVVINLRAKKSGATAIAISD
jgi:hypothetical protein